MLGKFSGDILCDSGVNDGAELNDAYHGGHQDHENASENSHFSTMLLASSCGFSLRVRACRQREKALA